MLLTKFQYQKHGRLFQDVTTQHKGEAWSIDHLTRNMGSIHVAGSRQGWKFLDLQDKILGPFKQKEVLVGNLMASRLAVYRVCGTDKERGAYVPAMVA